MKLRRFLPAGYAAGLLVGLGIVATYGAMEVSSKPAVCGSCHIMEPYYKSWSTSSHANIACVECHIPPGVTAELRKKYEALSMVASYFTGQYGTNPWAEVDDAACLECHQRRLLSGREVFGTVLFDHTPHLTELRRGKRLRCTSCHAQIVQGSHIAVTSSTCMLCHFKDQEPGTGTARCTLCHQVPNGIVDADGLQFDHGDVSRYGMECTSCHTPAEPDAGRVAIERCVTCHNQAERLAEYDNGDLLHQTHVTDHKIECTNCHFEIQHVRPSHAQETDTECSTCHSRGHSPQRDLYAGLGGKGVEPQPDIMFRAGVRCEGCHIEQSDDAREAGEVSCMSCHGPTYRALFESWRRALDERSGAVRRELDATLRSIGADQSQEIEDAWHNLRLVENGHGIHNPPYSVAVLTAAHQQINAARKARSLAAFPIPWSQPEDPSGCLNCHLGADLVSGRAFGKSFSHPVHVGRAKLPCETCHTTHDERKAQGVGPLHFGPEGCTSCHHAEAAGRCLDCHASILSKAITVELGEFEHALHVEDMGLECTNCHGSASRPSVPANREVCSDCH